MNVTSLNKKLNQKYGGKVAAKLTDDSIIVFGELDKWEDIIDACTMCVDKKSGRHVVNNVKLKGVDIPAMKLPSVSDTALDGERPDVLIIGGGISGASIARELSKWDMDILLIEKECDLAMQASGRNDGEVHPGVDLGKGSLKQHYVLKGNAMYADVCKELGVPFKRNGQYVGFTQGYLKPIIHIYAAMRRNIGVKDTKVLSRAELLKAQPEMDENFKFGLYNSTAGTVCPYGLTIAYAENAVMNGAKVSLNTAATEMEVKDGRIISVTTNRGKIYPKIVINAAGVFSDKIAEMAGDGFFSIHPRKGTNSILDKKAGKLTKAVISIKELSFEKSHTKGGGIIHTVHDNLLVGPDAVETYERENTQTNAESIKKTFAKQKRTMEKLSERDIITYFTGVRAPTFEEDFIIEKGHKTQNLIHCAGIQSPGLTTAPAVALDVEKMCVEMLGSVKKKADFDPVRKPVPVLREMSIEDRNALIKQNPDYGVMICRCEEVSKGEILDALKSPICVPTVDGIKKRVRPGMGRCQGGFCSPAVQQIIADFLGVSLNEVKKTSEEAFITYGATKAPAKKEGHKHENV